MDFGAAETTPGGSGVQSGEGTLLPESGSDSSVLLADLREALRAKTAPIVPATRTSVPFTYVYVGDHLTQDNGGGFSATPPGNWTGMKLMFGDGDRESEILLYMNAGAKKGQFSMKDPRFGIWRWRNSRRRCERVGQLTTLRTLDGKLQVRAERQQPAIAILHHKFARLPWHVGERPGEFDALGRILRIECVGIVNEQVRVE